MSIRRTMAAAGIACTLALTGCNSGDPDPAVDNTPPPAVPTQDTSQQGTGGTPDAAGRPAPNSCIDVPESADGTYQVADAGTAVVTRDGDRLVLGEVTPADGWNHEVTEQSDREIEIEFRRDQEELDLEVEIDNERVKVEICHDDD
jgi:hypothetical protein